MKEENKGLYLAVILSMVIIFVTNNYLFPNKNKELNKPTNLEVNIEDSIKEPLQTQEIEISKNFIPIDKSDALKQDPRVKIETPSITGSIRLKGARFDDVSLNKYKVSLDKDSDNIDLLKPAKTNAPYFAEIGWLSTDSSIKVPSKNTIWQTNSNKLTQNSPITLTWNNGQGLNFIIDISVDENFMFNINQKVQNNTNKEISLFPYGLVSKTLDKNRKEQRSIVQEGPLGVVNSSLEETKYSSLKKDKLEEFKTTGGWTGITDKYWLTALVFDQNAKNVKTRYSYSEVNGNDRYQADFISPELKIQPNSSNQVTTMLFSGAKEIKLLDKYKDDLNIDRFDLAIDFGWYYFLTKPFFYILDFLYHFIGNMGWAILLFAGLLRLAMFPIANKSYTSMSKMKKIQPKVQALQTRFADDKLRLQQEMMALYKKEKINPAAGCLPMLIQIPVFFSLYKVLYISIEIRHTPFFGWIKDLSAPDPTSVFTLFGLLPLPLPGFLDIGVWPLIMGITMFLQQKLNPAPTNKDQAKMMMMMPVIFTFMLGRMAAGLVIYWTLSNVLSIIQQKAIMKKIGVK